MAARFIRVDFLPAAVAAGRRRRGWGHAAFTLIELLVVVAIIALLISILLPSLNRARTQAWIAACKANCKQIATALATYQSEENGYVPVMFNYAASVLNASNPPARACWVSVALRNYDSRTVRLKDRYGGRFNPEAVWNLTLKNDYEANVMPPQYTCPFSRGKGPGQESVRDANPFRIYEKRGRFEAIQTWMWENVIAGATPLSGKAWPGGPGPDLKGVAKYTVLTWNRVKPIPNGVFPNGRPVPIMPESYAAGTSPTDPSKTAYRRWTEADLRRLKVASLSDATVAFCSQGEHMLGDQPNNRVGRANIGSHRANVGGTDAVFGDTHVEWVPGTRIGWW